MVDAVAIAKIYANWADLRVLQILCNSHQQFEENANKVDVGSSIAEDVNDQLPSIPEENEEEEISDLALLSNYMIHESVPHQQELTMIEENFEEPLKIAETENTGVEPYLYD